MILLRKKNFMGSMFNNMLIDLPCPKNISFMWGFGSLLFLCLIIQLISGIFLSMHYIPSIDMAFFMMDHIYRDVSFGWLMRFIHMNGASFFFLFIYMHIGRGIYYKSYILKEVWNVGSVMYILLMLTGFLGYILPWGQMSLWGATVITNLASAIPYIGNDLTLWIWGGFSVAGPTLNRFYSFHFFFPFLLLGLGIIHLLLLHETGSNNPLGLNSNFDKIYFSSSFLIKDFLGYLSFLFIFLIIVFQLPFFLNDPENFIPANSLVTPPHIQPEWYFLFAYAILRSIPNKLAGVIALACSIIILFLMPIFPKNKIQNLSFMPISNFIYWLFISCFLMLTWLGSQVVESPYILLGQLFTFMYFYTFLIIKPMMFILENKIFDF